MLLFAALLGSVLWGDTAMLLIQNAARTGPTAEQEHGRTAACLILGTSESLVAMGVFAGARLARRVRGDRAEAAHGMGERHGSRTAFGWGVALTRTAVEVRVGVVPILVDSTEGRDGARAAGLAPLTPPDLPPRRQPRIGPNWASGPGIRANRLFGGAPA